MKPLPKDVKQIVREYASDRVGIHPAAQLVKALEFSYAPEQTMPVYKPIRKTVCFPNGCLQEFYLQDFFHHSGATPHLIKARWIQLIRGRGWQMFSHSNYWGRGFLHAPIRVRMREIL